MIEVLLDHGHLSKLLADSLSWPGLCINLLFVHVRMSSFLLGYFLNSSPPTLTHATICTYTTVSYSHRILHLPQSCHHLYGVCLSGLFLDLGILDVLLAINPR